MKMELAKITEWLDETLNVRGTADVSNNGIQIAREGEEVRKAAFGVDASLAFLQEAAEWGAELAVVHHGISWGGGIKRIEGGMFRVVKSAIDANIALYAVHLPLDAHPVLGNNAGIARKLNLRDTKRAFTYHGVTIGLTGIAPDGRKIGVCSGGAAEFAEDAKRLGCDVFVTGEANWAEKIAAQNCGMEMELWGHYESEVFGVQALAEAVGEKFGIETRFICTTRQAQKG